MVTCHSAGCEVFSSSINPSISISDDMQQKYTLFFSVVALNSPPLARVAVFFLCLPLLIAPGGTFLPTVLVEGLPDIFSGLSELAPPRPPSVRVALDIFTIRAEHPLIYRCALYIHLLSKNRGDSCDISGTGLRPSL